MQTREYFKVSHLIAHIDRKITWHRYSAIDVENHYSIRRELTDLEKHQSIQEITDVLIHKGFMNNLRLMFSGIDDTEVKDLDYCLFFILCYSRFIRSALRKNQDG